ncbi:von Willebrand factor A domain-containing protein 7-like [Labrus bergylta]|uniref:von Willebrand factor A domain-containing protein 7-like n=1 Tax=Labrus bergylta TaxID=56723 RepID=UPI0033137822
MSLWLGLLSLLILHTRTHGFGILPGDSLNHLEITERAILNVTVQVCHDLAAAEGADFTFPLKPFSAEGVAVVCGAPKSSKSFRQAITFITLRNIRVDLRHALNASFHFDEEMFGQGRNIISEGVEAIKASNVQENYEAARQKLGEICHPLQDFYSHSNWVELGNKFPNPNLLLSDVSIGNIADESRATCRSCDGDDCRNNILEDIIEENILTSGYFGVVPLTSTKPKGKCSHGGAVDQTSNIDPIGGINKDTFGSSHGHLHTEAANMAIAATSALLEDIRKAAGDRAFLQMLGLSKGSSKALCFVIDTTKSMSDDIEAVINVISLLINSEEITENEPAAYILVPFSDSEFGPLIKTTDPKVITTVIDSLSITGGGDEEELSLSGLQLALSGAPSNSEIFLFTDAPAKDKHLKNTVIALIERTQTVINVMISGSTLTNRRRRRDDSQPKQSRISAEDTQLYRELSQASGGQTVEVTKSELAVAISIISDTLNSSVVTLLQSARNPGNDDDFPFIVDETITNLTVYITGRSVTFTLISPTGESQQSTDTTGSLITSSRSAGNLQTLQLQNRTGLWEIKIVSIYPYTLKVIGQSPIDFLFDFVEESQGTFEGFDALDTRPRAGVSGSLLVSLTGSATATVTEVALVESWGSEEIKGVVDPQGSGNFLVNFDRIPSVEFVVRLMGRDDGFNNGASIFFQRQTPTNFRSSNLTITADSTSILVPTEVFSLPFSVTSHSRGGNFTVRATNNQRFSSTFPTSLSLKTGDTVNGTVTLSLPRKTPSGTDVTLTIEVEAPRGEDMNYVMLRFTVINPITDFTQPQCELLTLQSNCSDNCSLSTWTLFVRVHDGAQGTGVDHVRLRTGNGTIITNPAADNENVTMVFYSSSCCSPDMELLVADKIGNVGTCYYSSRESSPAAFSMSTRVTQSTLLCLSIVVGALILTERGFY